MSEERPTYDVDYRSSRALVEDGFIPCHWRIAKTFGINEAIFLAYILGWGAAKPGQWVYRTAEEIERETCLTRRQQETVRANLKKAGALEDRLTGLPARLYYHVHWDAVERAMDGTPGRGDLAELGSQNLETVETNPRNTPHISSNHIKGGNKEKEQEEELFRSYGAESAPQKRKASRMTETWTPGEMAFAWCELSEREVARQLELFRDHFLGTGKPMIDWNATWRKWLRRAQDEFAPRQPARRQPPAADRLFAYAQQLREQDRT